MLRIYFGIYILNYQPSNSSVYWHMDIHKSTDTYMYMCLPLRNTLPPAMLAPVYILSEVFALS